MSKTMDMLIQRRQAQRKGRATPNPLTEDEFTSAGRGRSGTFTATETGARSLAARRNAFQSQRRIMNATPDQGDFEDLIAGKKGAGSGRRKGGY